MRMGRRKRHHKDLPPRLRFRHGAYYYVADKWTWLSRNRDIALRLYDEIDIGGPLENTFGYMMDHFVAHGMKEYAAATKKEYARVAQALKKPFGRMKASAIKSTHIAQHLDQRTAKTLANRETAFMSSVFEYARRKGWVDQNPCRGVRRNTEHHSTEYASNEEWFKARAAARPMIRCIVDFRHATAFRENDILNLKRSDLKPDRIVIEPRKTKRWGKRQAIRRTPELDAIIDRALSLHPAGLKSIYIFCSLKGQPYTLHGFSSEWQKAKKKAGVKFTFRGLRAKSITEYPDEKRKRKFAGHESWNTTAIYDRDRNEDVVDPNPLPEE